MKAKLLFILLMCVLFEIKAAEIHVPADYATIQEAIDSASSGDVIVVENGTYYENLSFLGKDIMLTSNFHFTGDVNDIINTIIDGSQATDSDIGSCVSFKNNETVDSIIKGFTITGGSGTKTYNTAEDLYFRTGGGILIDHASPTILNNIIRDNECTAETGVFGAGGGGMRMGFGQPVILNNTIKNNLGGYAGGLMIAYCGGATIKNNLIVNNTATGSFNGGGGVYVDWESITLENNTIANNHSGDRGGGIISTGTTTVVKNCILFGNTATNGQPQIYNRFGGTANVTYSTVEDGYDGAGNEEGLITDDPEFENTSSYVLSDSSPCIDAGNADSQYNDIEDSTSSGNALFPSKGTIRNDMGTYGGQGAGYFLSNTDHQFYTDFNFKYQNPYKNKGITILATVFTKLQLDIYNFYGQKMAESKEIVINSGENFIPLNLKTSSFVSFKNSLGNTKVLKLIKLE